MTADQVLHASGNIGLAPRSQHSRRRLARLLPRRLSHHCPAPSPSDERPSGASTRGRGRRAPSRLDRSRPMLPDSFYVETRQTSPAGPRFASAPCRDGRIYYRDCDAFFSSTLPSTPLPRSRRPLTSDARTDASFRCRRDTRVHCAAPSLNRNSSGTSTEGRPATSAQASALSALRIFTSFPFPVHEAPFRGELRLAQVVKRKTGTSSNTLPPPLPSSARTDSRCPQLSKRTHNQPCR